MKRYLFVIITISIFSCTEDIPIILPEQEEQLGAYVFINQTVDTASVIIERTLRFEETLVENNARLEGAATLNLSQEENELIAFEQRGSSIFYDPTTSFEIQEGKNYQIEINHPNFETMIANENAISNPVSPEILNKDSIDLPFGVPDDFELVVQINDQKNINNYYQLGGIFETIDNQGNIISDRVTIYQNYTIYIDGNTSDLLFTTVGEDYFLSDENFDGQTVTIFFQRNTFSAPPKYFIFRNISESFFNFMRFLDNDLNADYGAFLETIPVYSNFDMGFGVFAFFTEESLLIEE